MDLGRLHKATGHFWVSTCVQKFSKNISLNFEIKKIFKSPKYDLSSIRVQIKNYMCLIITVYLNIFKIKKIDFNAFDCWYSTLIPHQVIIIYVGSYKIKQQRMLAC